MPANAFSQTDPNPRASLLAMTAHHVHVVGGAMKHKKAKLKSKILMRGRRSESDPDTVFIACSLLENIAKRLDVCRASTVVCRLALSAQKGECDKDIATVLQWSITEELERQIERIGQIARRQSSAAHGSRDRRRDATQGRRHDELAIRVPRNTLTDICYRLGLVRGSLTVCKTALLKQSIDADIEVASTLKHIVIDIIQRQVERISAITNAHVKKGRVIAGVDP
jgi:hypothetical protein